MIITVWDMSVIVSDKKKKNHTEDKDVPFLKLP